MRNMPVKTDMREMKTEQLMHRGALMIKSDATLTEAIKKMHAARVSSLVVEPRCKGDAYGIITRRDMVGRAFADGPQRLNFSETKVYELMTKPLVTISPGLKVKYAARLMHREGVRRLPVFDGDKIVGILSNTDLFRVLCLEPKSRK